jgi:ABC-type branched-subunit amino acid transport system ATPase component
MCVLELQNISKKFGNVQVLNDVTLSMRSGTICALVGSNGAGKTTLFNIINGLLAPDSGNVVFDNTDMTRSNVTQRVEWGIGRLWQDVRLFEKMSVLDNLCVAKKRQRGESILPLFFSKKSVTNEENENALKALEILAFLGLEHESASLAENLSYGQQKLLAIGRLLMNDAELLLLDEPFSGLSPVMVETVIKKLQEITGNGKTIFMIEHNLPKTLEIADTIHVLNKGEIVASGAPEDFAEKSSLLREVYVGV